MHTLPSPRPASATELPLPRILVVDDNRGIHGDFEKILGVKTEKDGYQAEENEFFGDAPREEISVAYDLTFASQGDEALGLVREACSEGRPFSVVFMDVRMPPGWDGIETTARIWEVDADLQVVICTAHADYTWEEMIAKLGRTDRLLILKKPFDTIEVIQLASSLTTKWMLLQSSRRTEEFLQAAVKARTLELEAEVAERRRGEEALKFTQFSVDYASDAMFWVASDSRLIYANSTTCRALGYSQDELRQMSLLDIVPGLREIGWENFWESLHQHTRQTHDSEFMTRDGRTHPIELTSNFFDVDGSKFLCASARDTASRREILAQLASARDAAMESARLKGQFLANMSHEIRTPMNGVIGMSELIVHTNLDREQREYVDTIRSSAEHLLGIINDILDSSKIDSGMMNFESIDFDLRVILENALDVMAPAARAKKLELAGCLEPPVHPHLKGDPGRLKQILTNIVGNAVKFTESGEVTVMVSSLGSSLEGEILKFEVRDTGPGLDALALERIFEPFHQADDSNTRKHAGTGLGLSICKQIVEAMGGKIGVESQPGQGSLFWFILTFPKCIPVATAAPTLQPMPTEPVLLVDDNATNRKILTAQLANLQIRSAAASDGQEALALLRSQASTGNPYPLAILDMQMPEMDGLTLARSIKADPAISSTRIIILSSLGDHFGPDELLAAGVEDYVVKPVKQSRLEASIRAVMTEKDAEAPSEPAAPKASAPEFPQARILVAEDNFVNQKVAMLQLKSLGYHADLAADGVEVLAALERVPYDLILMDCQMPRMDGYETTRKIRQIYQDKAISIVALTANAMIGDREKCLEAGMDDHLSKPVCIDDLRASLENWLRTHLPAAVAESAPSPAEPSEAPAAKVSHAPQQDPPVDFRRLDEITAGNPALRKQLLHDYFEQAEEILALIALAIEQRNPDQVYRLAHKLGGSSATCGMIGITPTLRQLESIGKAGQLATAPELSATAAKELFRIRSFLAKDAHAPQPV